MTQPVVVLTDFGLAVETAVFALVLWRRGPPGPARTWIVVLFGSLAVASLTGGITHGFFLSSTSTGNRILWPLTLVSIGVTALAVWSLGSRMMFPAGIARRISILAAVEFILYVLFVLFLSSRFVVAIVDYLPAILFFLTVLTVLWRRTGSRPLLVAAAGVFLTLVASGVQQSPIAVPGIPHANNVLYHLLDAVAFLILFRSLLWVETRTVLPIRKPT